MKISSRVLMSLKRKKWYDETCVLKKKQKKQRVQEAARDFNLFKSEKNRKKCI